MRTTFTAHECGIQRDEFAIACGIRGRDGSGRERYLVFQRQALDTPDDGVHVELDDEGNSGYEIVTTCILSRKALHATLSRAVGTAGITEISVDLILDDQSFENLRAGLGDVFRGTGNVLHLPVAGQQLPPN